MKVIRGRVKGKKEKKKRKRIRKQKPRKKQANNKVHRRKKRNLDEKQTRLDTREEVDPKSTRIPKLLSIIFKHPRAFCYAFFIHLFHSLPISKIS